MEKSLENKMEKQEPSFEMVLEKLGPLGRFQMMQVGFLYVCMLLTSNIVLSFVFEGHEPPHVCKAVNETDLLSKYGLHNDSSARVIYESCDLRIVSNQSGKGKEIDVMKCPNGRDFLGAKHTTFLSEWDLVCESSGIAEVTQTCYNIGQMIGGIIGTSIADRFGRKPVVSAASCLALVAEMCIIAAPNIFVIYGLKLVSGIFYQSLVCSFFVYATEYVVPRHREANGCVMCAIWVFATLMVGANGYLFRNDDWRFFQGGIGVLGLFCLAYPFVLHESPRWLAANGKTDEALRILKKASKMNGKDFEEIREAFLEYVNHAFPSSNSHSLPMIGNGKHDDFSDEIVKEGSEMEGKEERKPNVLDLLRIKSLRKTTLITWYLFLTNILTYFGIYMTSSSVAGNRFLNFTLLNLVEIPSNVCIYYMMKKINRRYVLIIFLCLTAVSLMTSTLLVTFGENLEGSDSASTALFIFGKFAISSAFNVVFIVAPEIFPTNLRSTANGFCCGLARIGAMVTPFLRPLYNIVKWGPGLIFTVMCLLAAILTIMLPESKDANLSDTVHDATKKDKKERLMERCH